jgi:hypothetical protein
MGHPKKLCSLRSDVERGFPKAGGSWLQFVAQSHQNEANPRISSFIQLAI